MIESLRRWIAGESDHACGQVLLQWGRQKGWRVARVDDGATCVAEGLQGESTLRVEWGVSRRDYLGDTELRVRCMLDVPAALQLLALSSRVAEQLEILAYQRLVDDARTELDVTVPEEMRWLTMLPRVKLASQPEAVRTGFVVVASHTSVGSQWMDARLAGALAAMPDVGGEGAARLSLMLHRGRMTLRVGVDHLDDDFLAWALTVHEMATSHAVVASARMMDSVGWPTTASATWQTQFLGPESIHHIET